MTWGFPTQRRSEEFAALLERHDADGEVAAVARDGDLLELVGALHAVPTPTARPEFVADLRAALLAEARSGRGAEDLTPAQPRRSPTRERRFAAAVAGLAAVGVTAGAAVASQGALPGDALYPVKRVLERAEAGLSRGDGAQGATVLDQATDRLDEVDSLTRQGHADDEVRIAETLETFSDQAAQGSDLLIADYLEHGTESSVADLRDFASTSLDRLAVLEPLVPGAARGALVEAARTLERIDAEAELRCPDCGGTPITTIPPGLSAVPAYVVLPAPPTIEPAPGPVRQVGSTRDPGGTTTGTGAGPDGASDQSAPSPTASAGTSGPSGPLDVLTDGLGEVLGGGSSSGPGPSQTPSLPVVDDLLDEVDSILGSVVDPLGAP